MYTLCVCLLLGLVLCDGAKPESCQEEGAEDTSGDRLLQTKYKDTTSEDRHVYIGPNNYQEHETVCTEERNGWFCEHDSGNPEKRVNDRDPSRWDYPKQHYRVYRSTGICAKRTDAGGPGWGMELKISCRARKHGNWDKKAYWNKIYPDIHRWHPDYDPSEWETKELFIGANKENKESMCIEEREGWICDEDSADPGKRLNDPHHADTFKVYRNNPICAWMNTDQHANRWTQHLKIACQEGVKGCGGRQLKDKQYTWGDMFKVSGNGCVRTGDCVHTKGYPDTNYSPNDECWVEFVEDVSVCRYGPWGTDTGGPFFEYMPHWRYHFPKPFGHDFDRPLIESPPAMRPELRKYDELHWLVRGSAAAKGWQFCFRPLTQ